MSITTFEFIFNSMITSSFGSKVLTVSQTSDQGSVWTNIVRLNRYSRAKGVSSITDTELSDLFDMGDLKLIITTEEGIPIHVIVMHEDKVVCTIGQHKPDCSTSEEMEWSMHFAGQMALRENLMKSLEK